MLSYDEFEKVYQQRLGELLLPALQGIITDLCSNGGEIWKYISGLVVRGVHEHVYAAYETEYPYYSRRYGSGGLGDPNNVVITITDGVLDGDTVGFGGEMVNITPPGSIYSDGGYVSLSHGGGTLEDQIIGGYGYSFGLPKHRHYRGSFLQPRDFYETYREEFNPDVTWGYVLEKLMPILPGLQDMALEEALLEAFKQ